MYLTSVYDKYQSKACTLHHKWLSNINVNRWKIQQVAAALACTSATLYQECRWLCYESFSVEGKSQAISALMVYDWINQLKIGYTSREGKVPPPRCTLSPSCNDRCFCWIESSIFSSPASRCVIISSLAGKIRLGACIGAWLVVRSDELHACLNPAIAQLDPREARWIVQCTWRSTLLMGYWWK